MQTYNRNNLSSTDLRLVYFICLHKDYSEEKEKGYYLSLLSWMEKLYFLVTRSEFSRCMYSLTSLLLP